MNEINPVYQLIKEVRHTCDIEEVATLLASNSWVAITAASSKDGYLFALGRIGQLDHACSQGRKNASGVSIMERVSGNNQ